MKERVEAQEVRREREKRKREKTVKKGRQREREREKKKTERERQSERKGGTEKRTKTEIRREREDRERERGLLSPFGISVSPHQSDSANAGDAKGVTFSFKVPPGCRALKLMYPSFRHSERVSCDSLLQYPLLSTVHHR